MKANKVLKRILVWVLAIAAILGLVFFPIAASVLPFLISK